MTKPATPSVTVNTDDFMCAVQQELGDGVMTQLREWLSGHGCVEFCPNLDGVSYLTFATDEEAALFRLKYL